MSYIKFLDKDLVSEGIKYSSGRNILLDVNGRHTHYLVQTPDKIVYRTYLDYFYVVIIQIPSHAYVSDEGDYKLTDTLDVIRIHELDYWIGDHDLDTDIKAKITCPVLKTLLYPEGSTIYLPNSVYREALTLDIGVINRIRNPGFRLYVELIVNGNPDNIRFIDNPTEDVQLLAVLEEPRTIRWIKSPTPLVQMAAVKLNPFAIEYIKYPCYTAKKLYEGVLRLDEKDSWF